MIYKIFRRKYTFILPALLLLFTVGASGQTCPPWGISAVTEPSLCAASGKITLSFTGTGAGNVTDMLFSLEPLTAGGYSVSPNTSNVFENIPAGSYSALAKGICNNAVVSATVNVTVSGNYIPFTAAISQYRPALHACNTGRAYVSMKNGRLPYQVNITGKPASYTGRTSFTATQDIYIDSLQPGTYTVAITDACGAAASVQALVIDELSLIPTSDLYTAMPYGVPNTCNKFVITGPRAYSGSPFVQYLAPGTPMTYSVSFDGGPKTAYKDLGGKDTFTLAAGQTFKDMYTKTVTYYIRTACGDEVVYPRVFGIPYMWDYYKLNCATDFDESYYVDTLYSHCYPIYVSFRNKTTNAIRYDTIWKNAGPQTMPHMPFGTYHITGITADGVTVADRDVVINGPVSNPYSVIITHNGGFYGNDGAVMFFIYKSTGYFTPGTTISLTSPSNIPYTTTITPTYQSNTWGVYMTQDNPARYFYPGNYTFRVTDSCFSYDLPVTVTEKDVYRFNLTYTEEQTCTGLKIKPTGTSVYNNTQQPVYFRIVRGPQGSVGYDNSIVTTGDSLLLPMEGTYRIAMSSYPTIVGDFSQANSPNTKEINFTYKPLIVDVNKSLGWVCPGAPDNSGSIVAVAAGGSKAVTGVFTYRLAAEGKGATGPYWATNTTGKFSTATSGGAYELIKNQNYDVRVEDECGAAAVQRLKIIDFETAELATSDKLTYCIGDRIEFKIINLPTTAITYAWSGPDRFSSTLQNPVLSPVTPNSGGNYHVVIYSDICMNPIHADVNVTLAPYNLTCYSAVTDTSVNPYTYGLLGNWKVQRSYSYYAARTEGSTAAATNVRTDGTIKDFVAFWKKGSSAGWQPQYDTSRWVWNNATTLYNKKGFELENTDPLGRYNAAIYGFDDALTTAVAQNSRYRESAYEGFEDYYFAGATCDTACSGGRSFDFSSYKGDLDSTQQHTGKYSLRIAAGKSAGISAVIVSDSTAGFNLSFNKSANNCVSGGQVLGSIRTNKDAILPVYSPFAGKKIVISVWVKEGKDCKGITYTGNRMVISAKRGTTSSVLVATPKGGIIDGWQRYEQPVDLPADATELIVSMQATGTSTVYFDDLRIHPYNANMRSYVYNPADLRLMAELDENNYATFYEYDDDGTLIRLKRETESGIKTIKETRSALLKD
ncbi:hypothetical protein [Chitinophaga sp. CF418]|uniref:hypothetical protein n=1 Tax=Chitinophaga sp. CF418 TaxID=1855287 RepID=UPI00091D82B0|nr:hypothetical protein [Chitinophaga sp. CF418]SHN16262.1 hypothetical protein SAMN05216311_10655 [Chitinophaga sp. CF418]